MKFARRSSIPAASRTANRTTAITTRRMRQASSGRRSRAMRSALLLAVLLGACATPPPVQQAKVELPPAWKESAPPYVEDGRWWRIYQDGELDRLVDEALAQNSDLRLAAARVDEARALVTDAKGAQLPTVDARFGAQRQKNS